ncbi:MAG: hypothetical protein HY014_03245 [Acidobacteria bacterium]|nr:hypothetical protein [Acidobacteriota bacterium]MBI3487168.1 hypothetical protein [Acidobacteriota bacterium]
MLRSLFACAALVALPAVAQVVSKTVDFSSETVGAEPKAMIPMVGNWTITQDNGRKVLKVDGTKWQEGQSGANLADKARAIYGERYAEFLDSVKAFAYFPYVVAKEVGDFREGEITMRFKALAGRVDQAGGILFDLKANGDYLAMRANALENNLVLWRVVKGKRSSVKWIRNTPTPSGQWHEVKLIVRGRNLEGYLNGKRVMEHTLDQPVSGRVGIWTKADSVCLFDGFTVAGTR